MATLPQEESLRRVVATKFQRAYAQSAAIAISSVDTQAVLERLSSLLQLQSQSSGA
jgi:hypothetical protein